MDRVTDAANITADSQEEIALKQRYSKFYMFFSGLVFATLSFVGAHPITTNLLILKILETTALFLLFIAGIILLVRLAEYKYNIEEIQCKCYRLVFNVIFRGERFYWTCFIIGMFLLTMNRIILLFVHPDNIC